MQLLVWKQNVKTTTPTHKPQRSTSCEETEASSHRNETALIFHFFATLLSQISVLIFHSYWHIINKQKLPQSFQTFSQRQLLKLPFQAVGGFFCLFFEWEGDGYLKQTVKARFVDSFIPIWFANTLLYYLCYIYCSASYKWTTWSTEALSDSHKVQWLYSINTIRVKSDVHGMQLFLPQLRHISIKMSSGSVSEAECPEVISSSALKILFRVILPTFLCFIRIWIHIFAFIIHVDTDPLWLHLSSLCVKIVVDSCVSGREIVAFTLLLHGLWRSDKQMRKLFCYMYKKTKSITNTMHR